jgi:peptidoglycan/LPS O-acetylase OafA/YrhL
MNKISILQIFRGIAATMVFVYHFGQLVAAPKGLVVFNNIFQFGWSGVDFFFVLSGFIITYIHLGDVQKRSNLKSYFIKRIIRIYPIYWLICLLYLSIYCFTNKELFQQNDFLYFVKSFFLIHQGPWPFIRVAWSLCFEVFFYAVFGLFILMGERLSKFFCLLWVLGVFAARYFSVTGMASFPAFSLNLYILEFLMGCVVGYLVRLRITRFHAYALIIGLVLLALKYFLLYKRWIMQEDISRVLLSGVSFSLIIYGSVENKKNIPFRSFLVKLGDSSYVMYLVHLIPVALFVKLFTNGGRFSKYMTGYTVNFIAIACLILIVFISIFIHRFIELKVVEKLRNLILPKKQAPITEFSS